MCMHSAECCPVYCFITVLGKGRESDWPQWKIFHLRLYGMRLEMTYFRAELVQLIIIRSDSELEMQRLLVAFALLLWIGNHPQWTRLSPVVSSLPLRSHYTRMSACGRQGRWECLTDDRRHPGFHDEYQVTQMHSSDSTDSTLGQWVRQWTSQPVLRVQLQHSDAFI